MMIRIVRSKYEKFKGSDDWLFWPADSASFPCFDIMSSTFTLSKPCRLLGSRLLSCFDWLSSLKLLASTVINWVDYEGPISTILNAVKMLIDENEV